jgi:hypothetical protein
MQRVPPVTLGISSRQTSRKTSCRVIVGPSSRRSPSDRTAMPLSSTVLPGLLRGGEGYPAAAPWRERMHERVGDEQVGDEHEQGHRADRKGLVRCHTGQPRTARSAEPRGKNITKAPQKAVERHLCRARDTAEERADRRHAHHTAGSSPRRAQTCRLRKESDRRHAEEGWTRPQPGGERWLLPDRSTSSVRSWTRAPCLRSQLRCSLSRPPQASDPRVLAPRRPGATGRRQRGHERRRGADAQACSRCHPHPRSARPTPSRWPAESTVPAERSSECSSVRSPRCGPPMSR